MGATSPHREQFGAQSIIVVDWAFSLIAVVKRLIRGLEFSFAQTYRISSIKGPFLDSACAPWFPQPSLANSPGTISSRLNSPVLVTPVNDQVEYPAG